MRFWPETGFGQVEILAHNGFGFGRDWVWPRLGLVQIGFGPGAVWPETGFSQVEILAHTGFRFWPRLGWPRLGLANWVLGSILANLPFQINIS